MTTTCSFQHNTKQGTFIFVCHNAGKHFGYALEHEYTHPPHIKGNVALHAWNSEEPSQEPVFIGCFGCIVAHWEDCVDIILHPSPCYYANPHQIPPLYLLRIPLDLIQLDAIHATIRRSHLLLDVNTHIVKYPSLSYPIFFYCTRTPGMGKIELVPFISYEVSDPTLFLLP
jgi:hypothetical protein